jgi:predicted PurR-regulated permease PerM
MDSEFKFPFYAKASLLIVGMVAFIFVLYIGRGIIVPLIFAIIIAIVLHPVVNFLVRIKINRVVAIAITLILAILVIAALLNVIPYIGGIVAVSLPMVIALLTKTSPIYALYVLAIYYFIQLVDNNYIVPKIVASIVKVNALVSIIVVLAFGALWGIPGMFISIPLTAIIKLICDHFEPLKPWGFLLGDTMPPLAIFKLKLKKKKLN